MTRADMEKKYEDYYVKNRNYLKVKQLEDAFNETVLYQLKKFDAGKLKEINDSYISRGIMLARLQELREKDSKLMHFEDYTNSDQEMTIQDFVGEMDKGMEAVDLNIDIEKKTDQMMKQDSTVGKVLSMFLEGYKQTEIAKKLKMSNSVITRIVRAQTRHSYLKRRGNINKTNLEEFRKVIMKYGGKKTQRYVKLGDLALFNNGQIVSKQNYFEGRKNSWSYVAYVDEVKLNEFSEVCRNI